MNILFADDNWRVRKAMSVVNSFDWNYDIDMVEDGQEAVEKALIGNYDVCVMDLQMPRMDGIEATRQIRNRMKNRYLPIICHSACEEEKVRKDCCLAGMNDFINKPSDADVMHQKLIELAVKNVIIEKVGDNIILTKGYPVSEVNFEELREARKNKEVFFVLRDTGQIFKTHENIQNKISFDLAKGKIISKFFERNQKSPGPVNLNLKNMQANQVILPPEEATPLISQETEEMKKYSNLSEFSLEHKIDPDESVSSE